jgi:hypothetical protein
MADTAYDADYLREATAAEGAVGPKKSIARPQAPARQTALFTAPYRRMLLQQTQAIPARRHPLREDREELLAVVTLALSSSGCGKCPQI